MNWYAGLLLPAMLAAAGCAPNNTAKDDFARAFKQLDQPNPNYIEMAAAADAYLKANPAGTDAAAALYLHGRALEEKAQRDPSNAQRDWADAYNDYSQALGHAPPPGLEGLIHTGMGNVLYFQDRYPAAVNELSNGYDKLERDSDKAWALYRIGLCRQRMGNWTAADRDFAAVQQRYPGTVQAQRAREHQGYTSFWVQVATFRTPKLAAAAMAELKQQGMPAQLFVDTARNAQVVRVGPLNYQAALAAKQRVSGKYRDAILVP